MGVEGTQPAQDIGIFQTQSMCLGGAKKSLQSSLEKEEDQVLVLPVAKVSECKGLGGLFLLPLGLRMVFCPHYAAQ